MKRVHYIFFAVLVLISCEKSISDFQSKNFIKIFGSGYESKGNDVIELTGGGYLITGSDLYNDVDYQIFAAKVDEDGNLIWSKTYGDDGYKEEGIVVKEVSDGFIIAGTSIVESTGLVQSYLMKINSKGIEKWRKKIGKTYFDITIKDVVVEENSIYVAGYSDTTSSNRTDFFISKIDTAGNKVWDKYYSIGNNSAFYKIFVKDNDLLAVGNDGTVNKVVVNTIPKSNFSLVDPRVTNTSGMVDATYSDGCLYLLSNNGTSGTSLTKFNSSIGEDWHTVEISSVIGKSVTINRDGSLMICGETTVDNNQVINFIKVDKDGNAFYGNSVYKTFQGSVGKVVSTRDNGLIIIGSTNSTYGANIQLIKTDKDYFMLKN